MLPTQMQRQPTPAVSAARPIPVPLAKAFPVPLVPVEEFVDAHNDEIMTAHTALTQFIERHRLPILQGMSFRDFELFCARHSDRRRTRFPRG